RGASLHSSRHHPAPLPSPTRRSSDLHPAGLHRVLEHVELGLTGLRRGDQEIVAVLHKTFAQPGDEVAKIGVHEIGAADRQNEAQDRKSTRLNSSHVKISYAVFCLKKK